MKEAIVDIKMNPHKPKKPASDESTSDEEEMIVYDVEDEIESNPDYVKENATRGLSATDHVILNHGQVTWTTPELAPPSPNYHTTPTGGRFSSRQIYRASLPYTAGL
ncbi:hypothetical protein TNCV_701781 [Trichonephila clavipes]|nr:hypothetical protein TNCV_701781 [Trichonephila clavipes]